MVTASISATSLELMRPCIDCGQPANGTRCAVHQRQRVTAKRSAYSHPDYLAMKQLLDSQNVQCVMEGRNCTGRATTPNHIIPIIAGGPHDQSNLEPACAACNYGER